MADELKIRPMRRDEWSTVAELIHFSTNDYYTSHGMAAIFSEGSEETTRLFCEVYESLDPGCCLVAEQPKTGRLMGSCFYHPRETHYSLGIMSVHPSCFGKGVARQLLTAITDRADGDAKPTRWCRVRSISTRSHSTRAPDSFRTRRFRIR